MCITLTGGHLDFHIKIERKIVASILKIDTGTSLENYVKIIKVDAWRLELDSQAEYLKCSFT